MAKISDYNHSSRVARAYKHRGARVSSNVRPLYLLHVDRHFRTFYPGMWHTKLVLNGKTRESQRVHAGRIMKAPHHQPGQPIPPLAYPESILSAKDYACHLIGPYELKVVVYTCAVESDATPGEEYHVLTVMREGNVLLCHPQQHHAFLKIQHSSVLFDNRYAFFIEEWVDRAWGGHIDPYDIHISRLDLHTLDVTTHVHRADEEQDYLGIDVDSSGAYLLVGISEHGYIEVQILHTLTNTFVKFDCQDMWGMTIWRFHWGGTRDTLRCQSRIDDEYYEYHIDWEQRRIGPK